VIILASIKIGQVTHYYDKIGVAIIELDATLGVGDQIKFVRGGEDLFEQKVESLQVEHENIESAKKGDIIGLQVDQEVKEGAEVFKE
jgi:translation elongation factor EF-1alpha